VVASGLTFGRCKQRTRFVEFKAFLKELFASAHCRGLRVLHLILDNGPTHAPKQLGGWIASLDLTFEVRIHWLPKYASWLDQVEIVFSKLQRDVLTPNHFTSRAELQATIMGYLRDMNRNRKPVRWTYTKEKMLAKFAPRT
jgi:transposase